MASAAPNKPAAVKAPKKKMTLKRLLLIVAIVVIVALAGVSLYISSLIHTHVPTQVITSGKASISASLVYQDILFFNSSLIPYFLFNYNTKNISVISANITILKSSPPKKVYVVNSTNQCFDCGDVNEFIAYLGQDLTNYSILNNTNRITLLSPTQIMAGAVPPDSILIIPNGYLPDYMMANNTLNNLLAEGTSIIYIGQNFSKLIAPQDVLIPNTNPLSSLATTPVGQSNYGSYIFNQSQFEFSSGTELGPISYVTAHNGTVIAFSNFLGTWDTPQGAASDVSLAIFQEFWVPQIASGVENITTKTGPSETFGIPLNQSPIGINYSTEIGSSIQTLNNGYVRVVLEGFKNTSSISPDKYDIFYYRPRFSTLGTLTLPGSAIPGAPISGTFEIYVNKTETVEPHIDIFNMNHTLVESLQPFFSKTLSSNYTFYDTFTLTLPAGYYIAQLDGFNNQQYASALFISPPVAFSLVGANVSQGYYVFSAFVGPTPLNNETATIKVDDQYQTTVYINNGQFVYQLPPGVTALTGNLTFNLQAINQQFTYYVTYTPPSFTINKQYIYFVIAVIIVILEITLVKAPQRDDFYIDVPNMPEPAKTNIKIKFNDLMSVFDKQSAYYHWHYMPLSDSEFKFGVANNVKWQNLPVVLTYNNTDGILDSMVSGGQVVSADGFYAPKTWEQQSKHDIEYLVTFRKLRNYLTSHGQQFSDIDVSAEADITTVLNGEKAFIIIYSKTSQFVKNIPIRPPVKTYLAFLNSDRLEDFKKGLYSSTSIASEELKMYTASGNVMLLDTDNPEGMSGG